MGILAADFAGVVPASRGAHIRPLHPRLASLCSAQKVVHAYRGVLSQNGGNKFRCNCEPRQLYHRADDQQKKVLKGSRWLLLKAPENLDPQHDETSRLKEALKLNKPLALAYYLKEDLRQFWEQPGKQFATAFLNDWIRRAKASKIYMLQQMAKTLDAHRAGLLAYYDYPIITGPLEGTNNKIKTLKRQAYGFRDLEFFRLRILAIHEAKYALVG